MRESYLIIAFAFISCSSSIEPKPDLVEHKQQKLSMAAPNPKIDTTRESPTVNEIDENEYEEEIDDCFHSDDYEGLTKEWMNDLGKTDFIWLGNKHEAAFPIGQDTIFVSRGGCVFFKTLVCYKLYGDYHAITDSTYWLNKAVSLASEFGFHHYEQMILSNRITSMEKKGNVMWFGIEGDYADAGVYYSGVGIYDKKEWREIYMSRYLD